MKAQETQTPASTPVEQAEPVEQASSEPETTPVEAPPVETPAVPEAPTQIEIDGQTYTTEELKQNILRQSDYTRKTQEVARERERLKVAEQYYQAINANPESAKEIAEQFNLPYIDPKEERYKQLENEHQQLLIERDIDNLKARHGEFDVQEVLQLAFDKRLESLDDAYALYTATQKQEPATFDADALKEQIRQELLQELQSNVDTGSIISTSGSAPLPDKTPKLSAVEIRTAQKMRMTPEEYAKWK